jgi:hypothetical protein
MALRAALPDEDMTRSNSYFWVASIGWTKLSRRALPPSPEVRLRPVVM